MKIKIKVMRTQPEITDAEIRSHMNFDSLLQQQAKAAKTARARRFRQAGAVITGVVTAGVVWLFTIKNTPEVSTEKVTHAVEPKTDEEKTPPTKKDTSVVSLRPAAEPAIKTTTPHETTGVSSSRSNISPVNDKKATVSGDSLSVQVEGKPERPQFIQAEPVDGYPALYEYFSRELEYPEEALKDSIQGIVTVAFSVNKQGRPEKISIENSLGVSFDNECIRLIENMPLWKPASYKGSPMTSRVSIPLTFQIKNINR